MLEKKIIEADRTLRNIETKSFLFWINKCDFFLIKMKFFLWSSICKSVFHSQTNEIKIQNWIQLENTNFAVLINWLWIKQLKNVSSEIYRQSWSHVSSGKPTSFFHFELRIPSSLLYQHVQGTWTYNTEHLGPWNGKKVKGSQLWLHVQRTCQQFKTRLVSHLLFCVKLF